MADNGDENTPNPPEETPTPTSGERIDDLNVADEIKNSFLDYSMSVIISRALPDVRDGLKPSQRRILYAMGELSLWPNRKHSKCAKIVGEAMGNYHPHGDQAIYPTLVHMGQPWSMREVLIDKQGNFGSVEGDPPASMRYTEAKLAPLGAIMMDDMDRDTVDFVPNYDDTQTEPSVFPSAFPNLLVNGGTGIAVGMATNIPPHNLGEVIDAICAQIDNPGISIEELMGYVKGPDFPTGCQICGISGIKKYFETGRGSVKVRGRVEIENLPNGREGILVTEIPYGVNRATLIERIAHLVNEKVLHGITGIRDESDENTRVVIDIRRDVAAKVIVNNLYKHTALETSFSSNVLAIDHGKPKTLDLKSINDCFIEHRREVVIRRTRFDLRKAEERAEILEGYLIALDNLDDFIRIIRESANREEARNKLLEYKYSRSEVETLGILIRSEARLEDGVYRFSEAQANAILDLRLYQLTGLEREKVRDEYDQLVEKIRDLMDILAKESRVLAIIKDELGAIKDKYATPRKTEIVPDIGEIALEDLIANDGVIITITHKGLIKRTNVDEYRAQQRGGAGVKGLTTKRGATADDKDDFVEHLFSAGAHDYLLFFTNTGRVYFERVYEIPDMPRTARGRSIANLLEFREGETVAALIRLEAQFDDERNDITFDRDGFLFFVTQRGKVKKTPVRDFRNIRKNGLNAINIEEGDILIKTLYTTGEDHINLITKNGLGIQFHEEGVRSMGRTAAGVRGVNLAADNEVVAAAQAEEGAALLLASVKGSGKRVEFADIRITNRGGKGVILFRVTDKTGPVIDALSVHDDDEVMLINSAGQLVRIRVDSISEQGRYASGVRLLTLKKNATLVAMAPVVDDEKDEDSDETPEASDENNSVEPENPSTEDSEGSDDEGNEDAS